LKIALICPDSFDTYEYIEAKLQEHDRISKILCATTHSYALVKKYADKHNVEHHRETRGGKE